MHCVYIQKSFKINIRGTHTLIFILITRKEHFVSPYGTCYAKYAICQLNLLSSNCLVQYVGVILFMRYSLDKNISMYRSPLLQEEEPLSSAYQMREADLSLQIYFSPSRFD
jgi:hypothetical protein